MESAALDATVAGCLFSSWIESKGISKSTAYKWRSDLGIEPIKRRVGTRVEVWLSAEDESLLNKYGEALQDQCLSVGDALAAVGRSAPMESDGTACIVPVELTGIGRTDPMESDGTVQAPPMESDGVQQLRSRLAALRDAVELGAPLSTAEVSLLLGARPGGAEVVRGRLRAVREARNCWTIEPD